MRSDVNLDLFVEAVARGIPQTMVARGSSMWPALVSGDTIMVAKSPAPTLGSVVAVRTSGAGILVHRVCGLRADGAVLLKGDHNAAPDGWFSMPQVIGVVTAVRRGRRYHAVPAASSSFSVVAQLEARVRGSVRRVRGWCNMLVATRRAT